MPKNYDTRNYLALAAEYKSQASVFRECDKLVSASKEMIDLNRVAYKASENFFYHQIKMYYISGIIVQIGKIDVYSCSIHHRDLVL